MVQHEPIRKGSGGPTREIPDKLYFRIGEVAKLCEVPAYVLRFWEGEFPQLKPNKGGTGQRLFRRRDVEMALRIKTLLYDEGYTIAGARQAFKAELRATKDPQLGLGGMAETVDAKHLLALQKDLRDLHALLSKPAAARPGVQAIRAPRAAAVRREAALPHVNSKGPEATGPRRLQPTLLRVSSTRQEAYPESLFENSAIDGSSILE